MSNAAGSDELGHDSYEVKNGMVSSRTTMVSPGMTAVSLGLTVVSPGTAVVSLVPDSNELRNNSGEPSP